MPRSERNDGFDMWYSFDIGMWNMIQIVGVIPKHSNTVKVSLSLFFHFFFDNQVGCTLFRGPLRYEFVAFCIKLKFSEIPKLNHLDIGLGFRWYLPGRKTCNRSMNGSSRIYKKRIRTERRDRGLWLLRIVQFIARTPIMTALKKAVPVIWFNHMLKVCTVWIWVYGWCITWKDETNWCVCVCGCILQSCFINMEWISRYGLMSTAMKGRGRFIISGSFVIQISIFIISYCIAAFWKLCTINSVPQFDYNQPKAPIHLITGAAGCNEGNGLCENPILHSKGNWSAFRTEGAFHPYSYGFLNAINSTHLTWNQINAQLDRVYDEIFIVQDNHGPFPHKSMNL